MSRLKVSEEQFMKQIIELAHYCGWRIAHFRPSLSQSGKWHTAVQADGKGFPDLVMVRDKVIFAEVKSDKGKLSVDQKEWLVNLGRVAETYIWKPENWNEIVEQLR